MTRARTAAASAALGLALALAGCLRFGQPAGSPRGTYPERLEIAARLLREEDRRVFEPILTGRAASSPDPWVRAKAALAAGRLRDPAAGPHLVVLLEDPEPSVRRAAAFAAGIGGDLRLVSHVARRLEDADAETAAAAAEALGRLGGEEATSALVSASEREGPARAPAARAFFRAPLAALVPRLSALAASNDVALRRAAVYALARKPLREALPEVRRGLEDADPRVAALCARAAGILGDRASEGALSRLAGASDPSASIQALGALRALGRAAPLSEAACVAAQGRTADANAGVATTALGALAGCRDEASAALLRRAFASGGPRGEEALGALVTHDPGTPLLMEAGRAPSLELRLGAADAIARVPEERAVALAELLLRDASPRVRAAAVAALPKNAPAALLALALRDSDPAVREAALSAAAPRRAEVAAAWDAAYAAAFGERESDFTVGALEAAAELGPAGEELLRGKVGDPDAVVRATARRLLVARFGAKRDDFDEIPVKTRYSFRGYERIARQANETALHAQVETARGSFSIALDAESAPITVETFRELAARRFFDGTVIHRVVPDFVVQAGDPRGDGSGGPGFSIRDELNPLPYVRGTVGMALSGPDTGGSQFFVALSPQPHLDGAYTVFGSVSSGDGVLDRIEKDDRLLSLRVRETRREPPEGFVR